MPLLNSERFAELLDHLASMFDYVLVDAPPIGTVIDAAEIAKSCDGIKTEIDLRGNLANAGDMFSDNVQHLYFNGVFYKDAFTDEGKAVIKTVFDELCNPANYPIYIHCAQGIDRVGTVCYILEAVLGVEQSAIGNEYMLSVNAYGERYLEIKAGTRINMIGGISWLHSKITVS